MQPGGRKKVTTPRGNVPKTGPQRTTRREPGRKVTCNISVQFGLIAEVDRIAAATKSKTGLQMDRSKLLGMLSELLLEAEEHLTLERVCTPHNFKAAVADAIAEKRAVEARSRWPRKRAGRR
jgi:hypothetical protein